MHYWGAALHVDQIALHECGDNERLRRITHDALGADPKASGYLDVGSQSETCTRNGEVSVTMRTLSRLAFQVPVTVGGAQKLRP